jgi:hypothetical protein
MGKTLKPRLELFQHAIFVPQQARPRRMRECKPQSSLIVARLGGEDLPVHEGGEEKL